MAQILNTQLIYLDRSSVEHHRSIFDLIRNQEVKRDGKRFKKHECDAMFLGELGLLTAMRSRCSLHFKTTEPKIEINLSMVISKRDREYKCYHGNGKKSIVTNGSRKFDLTRKEIRTLELMPRPVMEKDDLFCNLNANVSRPNSICDVLNNLERGGGTSLTMDTMVHLLLDSLSTHDTGTYFCINAYLWLQKCIMYYSCEGLRVQGKTVREEVRQVTPTLLQQAAYDTDILIDTDSFTKDETQILILCLYGHENVCLVDEKGDMDIFSRIVTSDCRWELCTKTGRDHTIECSFNVQPPEVALSSIYSIVAKLGIIVDWLNVPDYVRGLPVFNMLTSELMDNDSSGKAFVLDAPIDHMFGTVFGNVCNTTMSDYAENSNLGASSTMLILECLVGQSYVNNFHYIGESLGIFNKKIFSREPGTQPLFVSMMYELGLFKEEFDNKLIRGIFSMGKKTGLYGDVKYFRSMLEMYVRKHHADKDEAERIVWLQANAITGRSLSCNSSTRLGTDVIINASTVGVLVNDLSEADKVCEWLVMHQMTDVKTVAGGASTIGEKPLFLQDPSMFRHCANLDGTYFCQRVEISLPDDVTSRSGYDSNTTDDLYYSVTYFSTGSNKKVVGSFGNTTKKLEELTGAKAEKTKNLTESRDDVRARLGITIKRARPMARRGTRRNIAVEGETLMKNITTDTGEKIGNPSIEDRMNDILRRSRMGGEDNIEPKGEPLYSDDMVERLLAQYDDDDFEEAVKNPTLVRGASIPTSRFREVEQPGDGNCLYHTITSYYESEGRLEELMELKEIAGLEVDGRWQSPQTAIAINEMLGVNTYIYTNDGRSVIVGRVEGSEENCHIKFENNHFTLLIPDPEGNVSHSWDYEVVDLNIPTEDLQVDIGRKYAEFLNLQGITARTGNISEDSHVKLIVDKNAGSSIVARPRMKRNYEIRRGKEPFSIVEPT